MKMVDAELSSEGFKLFFSKESFGGRNLSVGGIGVLSERESTEGAKCA